MMALICVLVWGSTFVISKGLMSLVTTSMMFIAAAASIPSYLIVTTLGIDNTYLVYIIPGLANTTCLFLMKQFLDTVPNTIFEAGKIDGASEWKLYTNIAIPLLKELTHLPVIVDPSHASGLSRLVRPLSLAAVGAGADGLMIEVHNNPKKALCDGAQSILPSEFENIVKDINVMLPLVGKKELL